MSTDELKAKYKLSQEENEAIGNKILEVMIAGKTPVEMPRCVFDFGPPGSGKTGLAGFGIKVMHDNVIMINNDELRHFHPKAEELRKLYPDEYIKVVNEDSKIWTDNLFEYAIKNRYNVIYEGTGRNMRVLNELFDKANGHQKIVRAMAVSDLNCLLSMLLRYRGQKQRLGTGRMVAADTFYKSYDNEMIENMMTIEKEKLVDCIEVYMRGEHPSTPELIYSSLDEKSKFDGVAAAIEFGRENDYEQAARNYEKEETYIQQLLRADFGQEPELINIASKIDTLYINYIDRVKNSDGKNEKKKRFSREEDVR